MKKKIIVLLLCSAVINNFNAMENHSIASNNEAQTFIDLESGSSTNLNKTNLLSRVSNKAKNLWWSNSQAKRNAITFGLVNSYVVALGYANSLIYNDDDFISKVISSMTGPFHVDIVENKAYWQQALFMLGGIGITETMNIFLFNGQYSFLSYQYISGFLISSLKQLKKVQDKS